MDQLKLIDANLAQVSLTGLLEVKGMSYTHADEVTADAHGTLVSENMLGIYHDPTTSRTTWTSTSTGTSPRRRLAATRTPTSSSAASPSVPASWPLLADQQAMAASAAARPKRRLGGGKELGIAAPGSATSSSSQQIRASQEASRDLTDEIDLSLKL
jgi:hypothetical protein